MSVKMLHQASRTGLPLSQPPRLRVMEEAFVPNGALTQHIQDRWQTLSDQSQRRGRQWYNGAIWSPMGFQDGELLVRQGDFRSFVGTRHLPASVAIQDRISPVGVAILPVEVDRVGGTIKSLQFFRRSGHSLDFAGYLSGLGGLMEPDKDGLDPVATAIREVDEEIGLKVTPNALTYLGTASVAPEHGVNFCYLLELEQADIDGGFLYQDGEMTHSLKLPAATLRLLGWKLTPAAQWVKEFCRLVLSQHGHRL